MSDRGPLGCMDDYDDLETPLFATQGGGYATIIAHRYVFTEDLGWGGYMKGDDVPEDWGLEPTNAAALAYMAND